MDNDESVMQPRQDVAQLGAKELYNNKEAQEGDPIS